MATVLQILAVFAVLAWSAPGLAASVEERLADRILGSESAPVTILEYSSLTCPHCATFHRETLPKIEEAYIAKGQVRVIFRDFPLDGRALAAAMVSRCVDPSRYYGILDILFQDQEVWARSADPVRDLKIRAQLAGLSDAEFDACINDQALAKGIEERAKAATAQWGLQSTPTLIVNDVVIRGALPFEDFRKTIDAALKGEKPAAAGIPAPAAETGRPGFLGRVVDSVKRLWTGG